jgi:glycosyltransferase involved in cell wall biosynthesis
VKVDLVMWTKNGENHLRQVLQRIREVIPAENMHRKILVDDHSEDKTVQIAREFGWEVYQNPKSGIASGANEALRHVDCEFFVSIEQDVLLAHDWWSKIPPYMNDPQVAVALGIRIATEPVMRKINEYEYSKKSSSWWKTWFSLDNNIFRTEVMRQIGGFPNDCPVHVDAILRKNILKKTSYKIIVDPTVVSDHIKGSFTDGMRHSLFLNKLCSQSPYCRTDPFPVKLRACLTSPFAASLIASKTKCLKTIYMIPLFRFLGLFMYCMKRVKVI